ncbi:calcium-binding protein [Litorivita pollutaquae]|uniref:Calcium-binding protein n=1 Tax=Litorivita pollutaquae TaxID=2200892 RepID=A0A2V4NM13_9RHOB|nr:calcium-binding protein [Litorivita pollutaquae]PYC47387.1 calcium-binding protein [Litorivita pollutaquae]
MSYLGFRTMVGSGQEMLDVAISDIDVQVTDQGVFAYATSGTYGGLTSYELISGSNATLVDAAFFTSSMAAVADTQITTVTLSGQGYVLTGNDSSGALVGHYVDDDGTIGSATAISGIQSSGSGRVTAFTSVNLLGGEFFYFAQEGGTEIHAYRWGSGSAQYVASASAQDTDTSYMQDAAALVQATVDGVTYLLVASNSEHGVTAYRVDAQSGNLSETTSLGAGNGLGVNTPTAMQVAQVNGETYVILGAAGSQSISVMRLDAAGNLTPTDHILDTLSTRFGGLTSLEVTTVDDRVYILAGGADDGISLFTLLPGGRLVHLQSIEDSLSMGLQNIEALSLTSAGGEMIVMAASQSEAGLTQLAMSTESQGQTISHGSGGGTQNGTSGDDILMGNGGNDSLSGGAGNDIIVDGDGADTLRGGAGADIFILDYDQRTDTIVDFERGVDRFDLSAFPMLYSTQQLTLLSTSWGARVSFRNEVIDVYAASGGYLSMTDLFGYEITGPNRPMMLVRVPVRGTEGNDAMTGEAIGDDIRALGGHDWVDGKDGDDSILGEAGNDTLLGSAGRDTLEGGTGEDSMNGGAGDDLLHGDAGHDSLFGGDGDDTITGGTGNDRIDGSNGSDSLLGGDGNDTMFGGALNDTIIGGDGDDIIDAGAWADTVNAGRGHDTVTGGLGSDLVWLGDGNDAFIDDAQEGPQGSDTVYGGAGMDTILALGGDDVIDGGTDNDVIEGGEGSDILQGGSGDDILRGQNGQDDISGGSGHDIVDGGADNDTLRGDGGNDTLRGSSGEDYLTGGDGDDLAYGGWGHDTLVGGNGNDRLYGYAGHDRLYGGAHNDALFGEVGNDTAYGGNGDDSLWGGEGDDNLFGNGGVDFLAGEDGDDILDGGSGADRLEGGLGNDVLSGGDDTDRLIGNDGNDTIYGGQAGDYIFAGAGDDWVYGDNGLDQIMLGDGDDSFFDNAQRGIYAADTVDGGNGNDLLTGGGGNDSLKGGNGHDTITGGTDHDRLFGNGGNDLVLGEDGNDYIAGNDGNDRLFGNDGDDTLNGGSGNDVMYGGAGDDVFILAADHGDDTITGFDTGADLLQFITDDDPSAPSSRNDVTMTFNDGDTHLTSSFGTIVIEDTLPWLISIANFEFV